MWTHAKCIKLIDRADKTAKVYILERHDGFYEYRGEAEIRGDEYEGVYWSPTEISGLYASANEAERAAIDGVPWLRQQNKIRSDQGLRYPGSIADAVDRGYAYLIASATHLVAWSWARRR